MDPINGKGLFGGFTPTGKEFIPNKVPEVPNFPVKDSFLKFANPSQ